MLIPEVHFIVQGVALAVQRASEMLRCGVYAGSNLSRFRFLFLGEINF